MSFLAAQLFPPPAKKQKKPAEHDAPPHRPRAVIIGGGYAGTKMASKLDSLLDVVLQFLLQRGLERRPREQEIYGGGNPGIG